MGRIRIRLDFDSGARIGPGKIRLLERVAEAGSIAAAARSLDMSYRRAWVLLDGLNRTFDEPVVATRPGGSGGGGARLTTLGHELVERFRRIERDADAAARDQLDWLAARVRGGSG